MTPTPYKACRQACIALYTRARHTAAGSPERRFLEDLLHCYPSDYRHLHQLILRLPAIAKCDVAYQATQFLKTLTPTTSC